MKSLKNKRGKTEQEKSWMNVINSIAFSGKKREKCDEREVKMQTEKKFEHIFVLVQTFRLKL